MTRRGIKARDFVDIYKLSKDLGIKSEKLEKAIIDKTEFMLKIYDRFRRNFAQKRANLGKDEIFRWGQESELLLQPIDEKDFRLFIKDFTHYLKSVVKKIGA
jgi:hypothetical protein